MTATPRRILVPTDFSRCAASALDLARHVARHLAAEVHLVHVRVQLDTPQLDDERQRQLEELLATADEGTRRRLEDEPGEPETGVALRTHLVHGVSAPEVIVALCSELGCDLVVMGTHGRKGLRHLLLGSVAERVVRTSPVSVLTTHSRAGPPTEEIGEVLVPHDFSTHSMTAVEAAVGWCDALGAAMTLLHVVEPVVHPDIYAVDVPLDHSLESLQERSRDALLELAEQISGPRSVECLVHTGAAGDAIVRVAAEREVGLVVMGTRGLTGLGHLFLGSVAETVLRSCPAPLLTVPP
jgi:nucleotide-binding universal stress UspA family protein